MEQATKGCILVVDDNQSILQLVSIKLEKLGYRITTSQSGEEALKLLSSGNTGADVILLDQMMPEMDGMETFSRMRKLNPNLPVIMLTGHGSMHLAVSFMKEGGADFVEKPVDFTMLEVKIRQAMERADMRKEMDSLKGEKASLYALLDFIGGLAHEINNPLNSIFTQVGIMVERGECVERAEKLQAAMDNVHNVLKALEKALEEKKEKLAHMSNS